MEMNPEKNDGDDTDLKNMQNQIANNNLLNEQAGNDLKIVKESYPIDQNGENPSLSKTDPKAFKKVEQKERDFSNKKEEEKNFQPLKTFNKNKFNNKLFNFAKEFIGRDQPILNKKDLKLNDLELLKINSLRPIILRLKLLIKLLESEKSFATLFKTELLNDKAELIINVINNMKNYKDKFENETLENFENAKNSFFNLIAILYKEPSLLNMFDVIFPYSQFSNKESPLYLAGFYLKAWNTLDKNK